MTSPTEQMLKAIRTRLDAADMKQYARHPDYWEMPECELSANAPEDLAKLIQVVEVQAKALRDIRNAGPFDTSPDWPQITAGDAIFNADAIAKGSE